MAFAVERLEDEPIVVLKLSYPIENIEEETKAVDAAIAKEGEHIDGRFYRIAEMTDMELSWNDVIDWLAAQRKANPGSINDPNVVTYLVSNTAMTQQTAKFAEQDQYGGRTVKIFRTLDEAIEQARKKEEL